MAWERNEERESFLKKNEFSALFKAIYTHDIFKAKMTPLPLH